MGIAHAPDENADPRYLHRLILIYQLISKDDALKIALASHSVCVSHPAHQQFERPADGCVSCSSYDADLQAEASADVSALRNHVLCRVASPEAAAAEIPSIAASAAGRQVEESLQLLQGGLQAPAVSSTAPSTVDEAQQADESVSGEAPPEVPPEAASVVSSSSYAAEPLVFAYDPDSGTAVPHSPSGISTLSLASPLGSPESSVGRPRSKAGRIFVDGVFDLLHSGHFNALRQARQLGKRLVVGVNSDIETYAAKGCWPIYTQEERAEIVASCKWVDEVVVGTPYEVTTDLLDTLSCEAAAHGDDWVAGADGRDAYAKPRAAGRMVIFKRTEGISSTCITRRLLEATAHMCEERVAVDRPQSVGHFARQALQDSEAVMEDGGPQGQEGPGMTMFGEARSWQDTPRGPTGLEERASVGEGGRAGKGADRVVDKVKKRQGDWSVFMSSKRLLQFIGEAKKPKPGDRVVYVDGSFDVLHGKA